jgi:MoaA/NifB/PqqE/SkfB family radical SAM enzyme
MYSWDEIRVLHIEPTTLCQARCPMCSRNTKGGPTVPGLPLIQIDLNSFIRAIPASELKHIERVLFCGNYGEPTAAKDLLEICRHIKSAKQQIKIHINTNGGLQTPIWWSDLASNTTLVRFGIDGLEDTNHLYRQDVSWKKVIENLKAFISAGGNSEVDFLVFKHNEHQTETAQDYFKSLGVKKINFKTTSRFFRFRENQWLEKYPVYNLKKEISHFIEPPSHPRWANPMKSKMESLIVAGETLESIYSRSEIDCHVLKEKSVYINADGTLYPCCWIGNEGVRSDLNFGAAPLIEATYKNNKTDFSIYKNTPQKILENIFFKHNLPATWTIKEHKKNLPLTCAKTCGKIMDSFASQFKAES